ncbi:MAG: hypothetical protein ACFFDN_47745, partial [Candidatus Hodarchaeota archaeon]
NKILSASNPRISIRVHSNIATIVFNNNDIGFKKENSPSRGHLTLFLFNIYPIFLHILDIIIVKLDSLES